HYNRRRRRGALRHAPAATLTFHIGHYQSTTTRPLAAAGNSMRLPFTKMEALGNDFVLMEWPEGVPVPAAERIRRLGDRRRGIGFDQLLLIGRRPGVAATYRVFNADGGEAEQSGNGVRCLARHLAPPGGGEVLLAGAAGLITAQVDDE